MNNCKTNKMDSKRSTQFFQILVRKITFVVFVFMFVGATALAATKIKLVILHTNDTHSQVEPTEKSSLKTSNMGGYARRMGEIALIRSQEKNVLLVDAGDIFQGTPYFNFYNGRVETDAMNRMQYDAATIGNHEFDNGIDTLAFILRKAKFPFVSSNYKVSHTPLASILKPYLILHRFGLKIGIMALDVNPASLIMLQNYRGLIFEDPLLKAATMATFLKQKERCDVIICLSHLGASTDFEVAHQSHYIDVIIGGHSHSMITNSNERNADGKPVVVAQMGKSGLYLGKVELELEKK